MAEGGKFRRCVASTAIATAFVLHVGPPAAAAPDKPAAPAAAGAALRQREDAARAKAAEEIAKLAAFEATKNAFDEARRDYARASVFSPGAAVKAPLDKIQGKKGKASKADLAAVAERRAAALAKCAEILGPAAEAYAQADRTDELGSLLAFMRSQEIPLDALLAKLEVSVYDPYLDWRTKAAAAKFDAGWDYVDGEWIDPAKSAERDKAHSTWTSPWVLSDDVHELSTNLPRHMAKQVLARVAAYRKFFVDYFAGEWDLETPRRKLPLIVTRTRKEMEERAAAMGSPPTVAGMAAFYLNGYGEGHPCFISVETGVYGEATKVNFDGLRQIFEHELGHQIAFEYSKHAAGEANSASRSFTWVVEGIADFMPNHYLVDGVWKLKSRHWIPIGDTPGESAIGWCHDHVDELPSLAEFIATPHSKFLNERCYHTAAAFSWFLLEGEDRKYRSRYVELLQSVHQEHAGPKSLEAMFPGESLYDVDLEFRTFLKQMEFDDD